MTRSRGVAATAGVILIAAAVVSTNTGMESALGRAPGSLAWGPGLFRAVLAIHGLLLALFALRGSRVPQAGVMLEKEKPAAWVWWTLAGLSAIAAALRVWKLDTGMWFDEIVTMVDFVRPPVREIVSSFPNQNQHMLFSLLAHSAVRMFGEHVWAIRLPSVIFAIGSIWALFLLGNRVLGPRLALLTCALMTVSYHHIWFSQNARGYMGLLFFATLSVWIWLEALDRRQTRWWGAYAICAALGIWVHLTMVFVLLGPAIVYLAGLLRAGSKERNAGWGPWIAWGLGATLTLQLLGLVLPEFFRTAVHEVSMPSEWTNPLWVVTESIRVLNIGWSGATVLVIGGVFLLFGWLRMAWRDPRAVFMMTLPPVIGGAFMLAASHNLWPRFFFFAMGFALIILMGGIAEIAQGIASAVTKIAGVPTRPALANTLATAAAILLIVISGATVPRVYSLPKQDYAGARQYAESVTKKGTPIITVGLAAEAYAKYYAPAWNAVATRDELDALESRYSALTLVYTLPIELRAFHPDLWRAVDENFETISIFPGTLGGGEVYVCRQKRAADAASLTPQKAKDISR